MKIGYLSSNRPDFIEKITEYTGETPLIVATDENNVYSEEDLAKVADVDALMVGIVAGQIGFQQAA